MSNEHRWEMSWEVFAVIVSRGIGNRHFFLFVHSSPLKYNSRRFVCKIVFLTLFQWVSNERSWSRQYEYQMVPHIRTILPGISAQSMARKENYWEREGQLTPQPSHPMLEISIRGCYENLPFYHEGELNKK